VDLLSSETQFELRRTFTRSLQNKATPFPFSFQKVRSQGASPIEEQQALLRRKKAPTHIFFRDVSAENHTLQQNSNSQAFDPRRS
jgi:hypothetical protein